MSPFVHGEELCFKLIDSGSVLSLVFLRQVIELFDRACIIGIIAAVLLVTSHGVDQ